MAFLPQLATRVYADSAARLAAERTATVTVCVPTVNEAATIGQVCRELVGLRAAGAVDRVLVLDRSTDATPWIAEAAGAEVVRQGDLLPETGPVHGKGDAMWRALAIIDEEITAFVDGDTIEFEAHMAGDLIAAVALDGDAFVKATYRRPFATGDRLLPTGGGRVTELTAKPLLAALCPELATFDQPLAGEIAARTEVLRGVPFATGYSVDVALLIDVWRSVGLDAMAQVDTGVRQNRHRPLAELSVMAGEVAAAVLERTGSVAAPSGRFVDRPPMAGVGSPLSMLGAEAA